LTLRQLDGLAPRDRAVLDAASVAGATFSVPAVAAACGYSPDEVEDVCAQVAAETGLLAAAGVETWPDGTLDTRYTFAHGVYREVLEEALPRTRRRALHRAIGLRLEAGHHDAAAGVAAELAIHFEAAGDVERAARHRLTAAAAARTHFADGEVAVHQRAALVLLRRLPATQE